MRNPHPCRGKLKQLCEALAAAHAQLHDFAGENMSRVELAEVEVMAQRIAAYIEWLNGDDGA